MRKKKIWKRLGIIALALVLLLALLTILNKTFHTKYSQMDQTDTVFFDKLNKLYAETETENLWQGFDLTKNPTIFVRKGDHLNFSGNTINLIRGNAYAVNVKGLDGRFYAKKLNMQPEKNLPDVYRLAVTTPGIMPTWNPMGNFSSFEFDDNGKEIPSNMQLGDSEYVFYFKYGISDPLLPTQEDVPFYTHENFHFTAQKKWQSAEWSSGSAERSEDWWALYGLEAQVLTSIQTALADKDQAQLAQALSDYTVVADARGQINEADFKEEKIFETLEGTATYVGIKTSQITEKEEDQIKILGGTKNPDDRNFAYLFNEIAEKNVELEYIKWSHYDSGALLTFALDQLNGSTDWQKGFNQQADLGKGYTLLEEIEKTVQANSAIQTKTLDQVKASYDWQKCLDQAKKF